MTTKKKRIEKQQLSDDRTRVRQNFFAICFYSSDQKIKKGRGHIANPKKTGQRLSNVLSKTEGCGSAVTSTGMYHYLITMVNIL